MKESKEGAQARQRLFLKRRVLLFASAGLVVLATLASAFGPLVSSRAFLYLEAGRRIANQGPYLDAEPFLFTATRPPFLPGWLAAWTIHGVEAAFGLAGLRVMTGALAAVVLGGIALVLARRSRGAWYTALGLLLGCYLLLPWLHPVPELLALPVFLHLLRTLLSQETAVSWKGLVVVVLLAALLANLVPLMLLALVVLQLLHILLQVDRLHEGAGQIRWFLSQLAAAVGLLVGLLATPWHVRLPGLLLRGIEVRPSLWSAPGGEMPELGAVPWATLTGVIVVLGILALQVAAWLFTPHAGPQRPFRRAGVGVSLAAAAAAILVEGSLWLLYVPLMASLRREAPMVRAMAARGVSGALSSRRTRWEASLLLLLLLAPLPLEPRFRATFARLAFPREYLESVDPDRLPLDAARFLGPAEIQGRYFHEPDWGGFLVAQIEGARIFLDGRPDATPPQVRRAAAVALDGGQEAAAILEDWGVDLAVLRRKRPPPGLPGVWALAYRNRTAAVWLRRGPSSLEASVRAGRYYREHAIPQGMAEHFEEAVVLESNPRWARAHHLLEPAALERALDLYEEMRRTPDLDARVAVLRRLGNLYASLALYESALREWSRALQIRERDRNLLYNIGVAQLRLDRLEDARRSFQTYHALYPGDQAVERYLEALDQLLAL